MITYAVLLYSMVCVGLLTFAVVRMSLTPDEIERYFTNWYTDEDFYDDGR